MLTYGDLVALLIATFGVGAVVYYSRKEERLQVFVRVLITMIIFLWVGAGLLWGA